MAKSACEYVYMNLDRKYVCLSVSLSVCLSVYLSVWLSVCLSLGLSVCLFVSLCVCVWHTAWMCMRVCVRACWRVHMRMHIYQMCATPYIARAHVTFACIFAHIDIHVCTRRYSCVHTLIFIVYAPTDITHCHTEWCALMNVSHTLISILYAFTL